AGAGISVRRAARGAAGFPATVPRRGRRSARLLPGRRRGAGAGAATPPRRAITRRLPAHRERAGQPPDRARAGAGGAGAAGARGVVRRFRLQPGERAGAVAGVTAARAGAGAAARAAGFGARPPAGALRKRLSHSRKNAHDSSTEAATQTGTVTSTVAVS